MKEQIALVLAIFSEALLGNLKHSAKPFQLIDVITLWTLNSVMTLLGLHYN